MNDSLSTEDSNYSSLIVLLWFEIVAACSLYGFGFLGNLFALIVFSTSAEFRRISTSLLFLLMTIFNFSHLCFLTIDFIQISIYHQNQKQFCQNNWIFFFENLTRSMSTYLSVGIAIDRLIRSELPLRARIICTRKNIFLLTLIIFILLTLFWLMYLFPISNQYSFNGICMTNQMSSYQFFLVNIGIPFRAIVFCFLPIIIMIVANCRMINNIRQARNRVGDMVQNNEAYRSSTIISSTISSGTNGRRTLAIDRMLLYILLSNILTFILTQMPLYIYMIIRFYIHTFDDYTHLLIYQILLIWSSIYFGIAFYLYCLASPLFRKKFIRIMRRLIHCQLCRHLIA